MKNRKPPKPGSSRVSEGRKPHFKESPFRSGYGNQHQSKESFLCFIVQSRESNDSPVLVYITDYSRASIHHHHRVPLKAHVYTDGDRREVVHVIASFL